MFHLYVQSCLASSKKSNLFDVILSLISNYLKIESFYFRYDIRCRSLCGNILQGPPVLLSILTRVWVFGGSPCKKDLIIIRLIKQKSLSATHILYNAEHTLKRGCDRPFVYFRTQTRPLYTPHRITTPFSSAGIRH